MEWICGQCHAVPAQEARQDWCPACGGAVIERENPVALREAGGAVEVDHRGIVLPKRHAVGGIITPR
jgi:hypothetical protein